MDYNETEKERLDTYQSQGDNILIERRDEIGGDKFDLDNKSQSGSSSHDDFGAIQDQKNSEYDKPPIHHIGQSQFKYINDRSLVSEISNKNNNDSIIKRQNKMIAQKDSLMSGKANDQSFRSFAGDKNKQAQHKESQYQRKAAQHLVNINIQSINSPIADSSRKKHKSGEGLFGFNTNQNESCNDVSTNIKKSKTSKKKQRNTIKFSLFLKTMKAMRQFKSYVTPHQVSTKAFKIINDLSSFDHSGGGGSNHNNQQLAYQQKQRSLFGRTNEQQKRCKLEHLKKGIKQCANQMKNSVLTFLDNHVSVFHPLNQWKVIFDIILIIAVKFAVFFNTVEVFFDISFFDLYPVGYPIIDWLIFLMFFMDILLNFNTGVYKKGVISSQRVDILNQYYKGRLFSDVISLLSFLQFSNDNYPIITNILKLLIFFKIPLVAQKLKVASQIANSTQKYSKVYNSIQVIKLVLTIFFVAHLVAIIFYGQILLSEYLHIDNQVNWVNSSSVVKMSDPWYKKYIFSLYFSVTTMVTVGYGDITPKNSNEVIITIISMVIACGVFAYSFNLIGSIISEMNKKQEVFKEKVKNVNIYLKDRNIDQDLRYQVLKYLEYKQDLNKLLTNRCPQIHYQPDQEFVILKDNYSVARTNRVYYERSRTKQRSLQTMIDTKDLISAIKKKNKQFYRQDDSPSNFSGYNKTQNYGYKDALINDDQQEIIQKIRQMYNDKQLVLSNESQNSMSNSQSSSYDSSQDDQSNISSQKSIKRKSIDLQKTEADQKNKELIHQLTLNNYNNNNLYHKRNNSSNQNTPFQQLRFSNVETIISIPDEVPFHRFSKKQISFENPELLNSQKVISPRQQDQVINKVRSNIPKQSHVKYDSNISREDYPICLIDNKRQVQFSNSKNNRDSKIYYASFQESQTNSPNIKYDCLIPEKMLDTPKPFDQEYNKQQQNQQQQQQQHQIGVFKKRQALIPLRRQSSQKSRLSILEEKVIIQNPLSQFMPVQKKDSLRERPDQRQINQGQNREQYCVQQIPLISINRQQTQKKTTHIQRQQTNKMFQDTGIEQEHEKQLEFDKMKEFRQYFPSFNFKNIIQNYNKLRNFSTIKLPPYFGVYSFYNRNYKKIQKQKSGVLVQKK